MGVLRKRAGPKQSKVYYFDTLLNLLLKQVFLLWWLNQISRIGSGFAKQVNSFLHLYTVTRH